jgi:hypothetical protein
MKIWAILAWVSKHTIFWKKLFHYVIKLKILISNGELIFFQNFKIIFPSRIIVRAFRFQTSSSKFRLLIFDVLLSMDKFFSIDFLWIISNEYGLHNHKF